MQLVGRVEFNRIAHFGNQPRLAQPGLAHHRDDLSVALADLFDGRPERVRFPFASHQRRAQPGDTAHWPRRRFGAQHTKGAHRLRLTLDRQALQRLEIKERRDEPVGRFSDLHGAGHGGLFHAGRQVDRVAQRRVLHAQIGADRADHHQASVNADTYVQVDIPALQNLLAIGFDGRDDFQAGQCSPLRIIFVRQGSAEEGQNAVAHQPRNRTFVAIYRRDHLLKSAVDDLGPVFRIEPTGGRGRSLDVAEEHRDDPPFALHGAAGPGRFQFRHQLARDELLQTRGSLGR